MIYLMNNFEGIGKENSEKKIFHSEIKTTLFCSTESLRVKIVFFYLWKRNKNKYFMRLYESEKSMEKLPDFFSSSFFFVWILLLNQFCFR